MIAGWLGHAPRGGFRVIALEIFEDHGGELDMFGDAKSFRQDNPIERPLGAFVEREGQERLSVADESDFSGSQAQTFPKQTHQAIALRAAGCIAMAAGGENQAHLLQRARVGWNGARHLIGETFDEQRMARIDIIVVECDVRVSPARFGQCLSQSLALQEVEVERSGEHEYFVRALRRYMLAEGADILAIVEGRAQLADGDAHDMDDVLDEIERLIRTPAKVT